MTVFEGQCAHKVLQSAISVEVGDGEPCGSNDTRVIDVLETKEVPENGHIGIRTSPPRKGGINSPTEVHLRQCTQHGHQTGGAGSH